MFIQKQRLVAKRAGDETKYFTFEMLNRNIVVREGIIGIDPDQEIDSANRAERKWITEHPERKSSSRDVRIERHKQVSRMNQARSKKHGSESSRTTHIAA
jgi:sensor histidine kinase regulating citrate/malate metabolism